MELKILSAKEAREETLSSHSLEKHVFREILESARDNKNHMLWYVEDYDPQIIQQLITKLKELGYVVEYIKEPDDIGEGHDTEYLQITW